MQSCSHGWPSTFSYSSLIDEDERLELQTEKSIFRSNYDWRPVVCERQSLLLATSFVVCLHTDQRILLFHLTWGSSAYAWVQLYNLKLTLGHFFSRTCIQTSDLLVPCDKYTGLIRSLSCQCMYVW
jgi:hypothetical protein